MILYGKNLTMMITEDWTEYIKTFKTKIKNLLHNTWQTTWDYFIKAIMDLKLTPKLKTQFAALFGTRVFLNITWRLFYQGSLNGLFLSPLYPAVPAPILIGTV